MALHRQVADKWRSTAALTAMSSARLGIVGIRLGAPYLGAPSLEAYVSPFGLIYVYIYIYIYIY